MASHVHAQEPWRQGNKLMLDDFNAANDKLVGLFGTFTGGDNNQVT